MSSGSNAPRKQNVAASGTSSLFKASSRFLHSGERNGSGAGISKGMKRQRAGAASLDSAESNNNNVNITEVSRCFALEEQKESSGVKSKKRFVGVRQRPSGRWVAEIKDTTQKIRLWLGTFDSAEEGAKAYDSAARALRGANTRTNFVPAMACEGTVPASKAARLIRLRQIAAASKACEKEAARNGAAMSPPEPQKGAESSHHSPLVRQDLQQSISSLDPLPPRSPDDHPLPSTSPSPKPARLLASRRHNAPLACAKPEQVESDDGHGTKKLVDAPPPPSAKQLEPQLSITSENLSNAITHSLSPQESSSSPDPRRVPSPRSPFECMQPTDVQSVNSFVDATDHLKSFNQERFTAPTLESFPAFPVDNFVAPPPIPFHVPPLDTVAYPHQISSCATNRDHVSMYAATSENDHEVMRRRGRSLSTHEAMNLDEEKQNCVTETQCGRASKELESMDYSNMYRTELKHDGCILREREFVVPELVVPELVVPEIPWPDYVLMDEMGTGLLGLDHLSCEHSGVYTSAFDFSAEAIDRDSCTSGVLLEEHLSDDSKFFRMQYEQSGTPPHANQDFQECVLLTEPPELEYSLSPGVSQLSPQETTHMSSSLLWRLDDTTTTAWDGQSSGSTESTTNVVKTQPGDGGECTSSQDHEALWSSMDLPPLCMVA